MLRQNQLLIESTRVIEAVLKTHVKPCVLWSAGKDSMVMLHILRKRGYDFPVVCFREPWMPWKLEFTNQVIQDWNLEVWDYPPNQIQLCDGNGRIDIMQDYRVGPTEVMTLARGTEPPKENEPWLCGRDTFLSKPTGDFNFPWDLMFHGHKSVDEDPTSGKIPLAVDILQRPGSAAAVYPLRHWTDEDVFQYIWENDVPYDKSRYVFDEHGFSNLSSDKSKNPDYYATCMACCDRNGPDFVTCPKSSLQINNVGKQLPWYRPEAAYCDLRQ